MEAIPETHHVHKLTSTFLQRYNVFYVLILDCSEGFFLCKDGQCILDYWRCNGVADCSNGEDEENCDTGMN